MCRYCEPARNLPLAMVRQFDLHQRGLGFPLCAGSGGLRVARVAFRSTYAYISGFRFSPPLRPRKAAGIDVHAVEAVETATLQER